MTESFQQTLVGAFAGTVEVTAMQPTIAIKNALQERRPIPFSVTGLYRGYGINVGTMAPITAFQFGAANAYSELFRAVFTRSPRGKESVMCAAAGGASSVAVSGPAELLVIQQQRAGITSAEAVKRVVGGYGLTALYKGGVATACRDGLVVASMLGLCPVFVAELEALDATKGLSKSTKLAVGATAAGMVGTGFSMPFDAAKTLQQANLDKELSPEYATLRGTLSKIYGDAGLTGLYSGTLPRGFRIICAAFILNTVKDWANEMIGARGEGTSK
uniref:Mitochondrial carrier family n=1 Tax=Tetraselmis sp. GSL018 TaxID=582737 RepID=A0A061QX03_9CHLO